MEYILITGASMGIGYAFAEYYASLGYGLILVARSEDELLEAEMKIKEKYETDVHIIPYDLTLNPEGLFPSALALNKDIRVVINNAGMGLAGEFTSHDLKREEYLLDLNMKALTILCHMAGNYFREKKKGTLLNVSSVGAYMPGPFMATYYASKSYVTSLSLSLYYELREYNVWVSSVQLPRIDTLFDLHAGRKEGMKKGKSASWAVKKCDKALQKKKPIINIGLSTKMAYFANKVVPKRIYAHIIAKKFRNY